MQYFDFATLDLNFDDPLFDPAIKECLAELAAQPMPRITAIAAGLTAELAADFAAAAEDEDDDEDGEFNAGRYMRIAYYKGARAKK